MFFWFNTAHYEIIWSKFSVQFVWIMQNCIDGKHDVTKEKTDYHFKKNGEKSPGVCCLLPRFSWWIICKLIFLIAKDLRIEWRSFKISIDGDVRNLPTRSIEWKMHTTRCLRNCNQNMVIIGTVTGLHKIYWSPEISHRWFWDDSETWNVWAFFHSFWKVILKRNVFGELKPQQLSLIHIWRCRRWP